MKNLKFFEFPVGGSRSQGFRKYLILEAQKLVSAKTLLLEHYYHRQGVPEIEYAFLRPHKNVNWHVLDFSP